MSGSEKINPGISHINESEKILEAIEKNINSQITKKTVDYFNDAILQLIPDIIEQEDKSGNNNEDFYLGKVIEYQKHLKNVFLAGGNINKYKTGITGLRNDSRASLINSEFFHDNLKIQGLNNDLVGILAFLGTVFLGIEYKDDFNIKDIEFIKELVEKYALQGEQISSLNFSNSTNNEILFRDFMNFGEYLNKIAIISNNDTKEGREIATIILEGINSNLNILLEKLDKRLKNGEQLPIDFGEDFIMHSRFLEKRSILNQDIEYITIPKRAELKEIYEKDGIYILIEELKQNKSIISKKIINKLTNLLNIAEDKGGLDGFQPSIGVFNGVLSFNTTTMLGMFYYKITQLDDEARRAIQDSNIHGDEKKVKDIEDIKNNISLNKKILKKIIENNLIGLMGSEETPQISQDYIKNILHCISNNFNSCEDGDLYLFKENKISTEQHVDSFLEKLNTNQEIDDFEYKTIYYLMLYTDSISIDKCVEIAISIMNSKKQNNQLVEHERNSIIEYVVKKASIIPEKDRLSILENTVHYVEEYHKSESNFDFGNIIEDLIISYLKHCNDNVLLKKRLEMLSYFYYIGISNRLYNVGENTTRSYSKIEQIGKLIKERGFKIDEKLNKKSSTEYGNLIENTTIINTLDFKLGMKFIIENEPKYKKVIERTTIEYILSVITREKNSIVSDGKLQILKHTGNEIGNLIRTNIFFGIISNIKIICPEDSTSNQSLYSGTYGEKIELLDLKKGGYKVLIKYREVDKEKIYSLIEENKIYLNGIINTIIDYEDSHKKIEDMQNPLKVTTAGQIVRNLGGDTEYIEILFRYVGLNKDGERELGLTPYFLERLIEALSEDINPGCINRDKPIEFHQNCQYKHRCRGYLSKVIGGSAEKITLAGAEDFLNKDKSSVTIGINADQYNLNSDLFKDFLKRNQKRADRIVIEIIENINPSEENIKKILEIKKMGYKLAIDDYPKGTTKKILEKLKDIIDIVKIDKLTALKISDGKTEFLTELENLIKEINSHGKYEIIIEGVEAKDKILHKIKFLCSKYSGNQNILLQGYYEEGGINGQPVELSSLE